jgi:hypothetical protein
MATRRRRKARSSVTTMRRGGGLRRMPDLLSRVLEPAARRRGLAEARLLTDWPMIIGPQLGARCQPVRLARNRNDLGGVLSVHVSSVSALELQHSEPQLIERINGFFGYPAVARLRLIQAPPMRPVKRPGRRSVRPLDASELEELRAAVGSLADPELRQALARLGQTIKAQIGEAEDADDAGRVARSARRGDILVPVSKALELTGR